MKDQVTIGIAQYFIERGAPERNLQATLHHIDEVAKYGVDVIMLPEMWTIGYDWRNYYEFTRKYAEPIPGRATTALSEAARRHRVYLVGGSIAERDGERFHNTALLFSPTGELIATHRKVHLYTAANEHKVLTPGDRFTVVETEELGNVGLCICYDGDFAETARIMALRGADIVFHVNAYESPCESWWEKFYVYNAMNNAMWWVMSNMVGDYDDLHFFGVSKIISPKGEVAAAAPYVAARQAAVPYYLVHTIALKRELEEARAVLGCFLRDRRPEVYEPLTAVKSS